MSDNQVVSMDISPFLTPIALVISAIIFSMSFLGGSFMIADAIEDGGGVVSGTSDTSVADAGSADTGEVSEIQAVLNERLSQYTDFLVPDVQTSLDDDAVLGDRDADIAIVEFSDLECPFCQRHHNEEYPTIKSEIIDDGRAMYVFRDYPLSFHDPVATEAANAAQCTFELAGDDAYFSFLDNYFAITISNGEGLPEGSTYETVARDSGVNDIDAFNTCVSEGRYTEEIQADLAAGTEAQVSGTPGFVVGRVDGDGVVTGINVSGALPYTVFNDLVDIVNEYY